jgi:hypothetical protein
LGKVPGLCTRGPGGKDSLTGDGTWLEGDGDGLQTEERVRLTRLELAGCSRAQAVADTEVATRGSPVVRLPKSAGSASQHLIYVRIQHSAHPLQVSAHVRLHTSKCSTDYRLPSAGASVHSTQYAIHSVSVILAGAKQMPVMRACEYP